MTDHLIGSRNQPVRFRVVWRRRRRRPAANRRRRFSPAITDPQTPQTSSPCGALDTLDFYRVLFLFPPAFYFFFGCALRRGWLGRRFKSAAGGTFSHFYFSIFLFWFSFLENFLVGCCCGCVSSFIDHNTNDIDIPICVGWHVTIAIAFFFLLSVPCHRMGTDLKGSFLLDLCRYLQL